MQAQETSLLKFLGTPNQFVVPVYQRSYEWTQRQCRRLWDDVKKVGTDDSIRSHFISSIVYIADDEHFLATEVKPLLVVDGQQRLTTVTLLLAALAREAQLSTEDVSLFSAKEIQGRYLVNEYANKNALYYKVLLRQDNHDHLKSIVDGREPTTKDAGNSKVYKNFLFFQQKIRESRSRGEITLDQLYEGVSKLAVVEVTLNRQTDNPQVIFQNLNTAGLVLSQADLVRNYVLMDLDPDAQETLYENIWQPMEQVFKDDLKSKEFSSFIRDYLTMKLGHSSKVNEVYETFEDYVNSPDDMSETVQDMYKHSRRYAKIAGLDRDVPKIQQVLRDIDYRLDVKVARPFLLKVYGDYSEGVISKDDFVKVLHLVESFVVRRRICDLKDNALGRVFVSLISELDERDYVGSFERALVALVLKNEVHRFPIDSEFRSKLVSRAIYNSAPTKYLLDKLENFGRKEKVNVSTYTIEHIMPQKDFLSDEWKRELGERWSEVHGEYLHTLGNLTLTGYNAELGARPFKEKRDMEGGYNDTPIRLSREYLATLERWDEKAVKSRAESLADTALNIWIAPKAPHADAEA